MKATRSIVVGIAFMVCFAAIWGCGPRTTSASLPTQPPPGSPVAATAVECGLFPGQSESTEAISTVGLAEPVDPVHAPHPSNDSERLLFRQLYETLIRADCEGHAAPGLAAAWRLDVSSNTWIVTLRPNARFSDNTPVTARDI